MNVRRRLKRLWYRIRWGKPIPLVYTLDGPVWGSDVIVQRLAHLPKCPKCESTNQELITPFFLTPKGTRACFKCRDCGNEWMTKTVR